MATFNITNTASGHSFGNFRSTTPEGAIRAMYRDAGYTGPIDPELKATLVTRAAPAVAPDTIESVSYSGGRFQVWAEGRVVARPTTLAGVMRYLARCGYNGASFRVIDAHESTRGWVSAETWRYA